MRKLIACTIMGTLQNFVEDLCLNLPSVKRRIYWSSASQRCETFEIMKSSDTVGLVTWTW